MTTARTLVTAGRRKHVLCRQTSRLLACKGRIDLTVKATGETVPPSELALKLQTGLDNLAALMQMNRLFWVTS